MPAPADPLAVLPGIRDVIAALAAESDEDLRLSGPDRLAEAILAVQRAKERLEAQLLRRVAVFERTDGYRIAHSRSTKSFLAQHAQLSEHHARTLVTQAQQLERVPVVASADAALPASARSAMPTKITANRNNAKIT